MATAGVAVSVSMGVMKPVLEKLSELMANKYKKFKGLRKEVSFLKDELGAMYDLLESMDAADELDLQAKNWRKDIIDMSYDIEDYIDDFMHSVGETDNKVGFLQKASHCLKTIKDRYRIANQINKIKTRVIQTSQRRERYKFNVSLSSTTSVVVDPRLAAIYNVDSATFVGIDTQKEELVKWTMDEEQHLKVASIVGCGGLGKTTLANEVYREVGVQINCKAFVSVSQNLDITRLLNSILSQLGLHTNPHVYEMDLINHIREYLKDKRYFILVDDLWDIQAWRNISCVFPQNNQRSRVMITTRNEDVAIECCGNHGCIHNMWPLSEQDSRKLFFSRVFGSEDACPSQFTEVSCEILKKCGGLPLAIITVSSILACQPRSLKKQWEYLRNSLATGFSENSTLKDMMHILDLSYKCLPHHLKACFLYLGTYPEDHMISRAELVRRWVAEGIVSFSPGQDVWDVADSYFNELVNRSLVQPAYEDDGIMVSNCRVHDMMLELIVSKCKEDNFVSFINDLQLMAEGKDKVIRRLTIDLRGVKDGRKVMATTSNLWLSQVRSLSIFEFEGSMLSLNHVEFKFVRVLFLSSSYDQRMPPIDLTGINQLSQLRYLKLKGLIQFVLPSQIRGLRLLETLDFSELLHLKNIILPDILEVPRLSHLAMNDSPLHGIGKLKSLRTLRGFSISTLRISMSLLESIMGLGELTALSELDLDFSGVSESLQRTTWMAALSTSLEKLGNLKLLSVKLFCCVAYCADAQLTSSFWPPFHNLEKLHVVVGWTFSSIPSWIGHLHNLRELGLGAKQILQEDVDMIGTKLPSLVKLDLQIVHVLAERIVIGRSTGFTVLKLFKFNFDEASYLTFEAGAMPNLRELFLLIDADKWDKATPVGLQHLLSLKKIEVECLTTISREEASYVYPPWREEKAKNALIKSVFQEVADALPTRAAFNVKTFVMVRSDEEEECDDLDQAEDGRGGGEEEEEEGEEVGGGEEEEEEEGWRSARCWCHSGMQELMEDGEKYGQEMVKRYGECYD